MTMTGGEGSDDGGSLRRRLQDAVAADVAVTRLSLLTPNTDGIDEFVSRVLQQAHEALSPAGRRSPPFLTCWLATGAGPTLVAEDGIVHVVVNRDDVKAGGLLEARIRRLVSRLPPKTPVNLAFLSWAELIDYLRLGDEPAADGQVRS
jgi:hypothetical protein